VTPEHPLRFSPACSPQASLNQRDAVISAAPLSLARALLFYCRLAELKESGISMLRTMISDTPFEQRWVLQGRLCSEWAADLKERWESTRSARIGRKCIVDLEDVILVDTQGEAVLLEMVTDGAALLATRAYMKDKLESLHLPPNSATKDE
jgi:ABC-type transporter Mla MlaB component